MIEKYNKFLKERNYADTTKKMLLSIAKDHIQYNTFDIKEFNAEPIREHIFDVITKHSHPSIQNQTIHGLNVFLSFSNASF